MHNAETCRRRCIRTVRFMNGIVSREAETEEERTPFARAACTEPAGSAQSLSIKPDADLASRFTGDDLRGGSPIEEPADEAADGAGLRRAVAFGDGIEEPDDGRAS